MLLILCKVKCLSKMLFFKTKLKVINKIKIDINYFNSLSTFEIMNLLTINLDFFVYQFTLVNLILLFNYIVYNTFLITL